MSGRGVLSNERAVDDQSRQAPAAQATPPWTHIDWDAHQAAGEAAFHDTMAMQTADRMATMADVAERVAKADGQPFDTYYLALGGEPAGYAPQIDTNKLYARLAAMPDEQRRAYGIGSNPQEFENMMRAREGAAAADREHRMSKGGALGNFAGGVVGGQGDPVNLATLPLGGWGKGVVMPILTEGLTQMGVETLETPLTAAARIQQNRTLTPGEAAANIAMAGAGGAVVKSLHLAGGAAVDSALEASKPWRMAQALKLAQPEGKLLPPDQLAAINVAQRAAEIDATNPYQNTYQAQGAHRERIDAELQRIAAATPGGALETTMTTTPPAAGVAPRLQPVAPGAGGGFLSDHIVEGLLRRGLTETQARGVAAGIHAESRSDPNALGPVQETTGHRALGLGQWLGSRRDAIIKRYGENPTLDQQLDFLVEELKGGHPAGGKVLGQKDAAAVARSYIEDFMVPGAKDVPADVGRAMEALGLGGQEAPATGAVAAAGTEPLPPVPELDAGPGAAEVAARGGLGVEHLPDEILGPVTSTSFDAPTHPETGDQRLTLSSSEITALREHGIEIDDDGNIKAAEVEKLQAERARRFKGGQRVTPDEPLTVRPEVTREALVPIMRQIIADPGQRLDVARLAEALGQEPRALRRALDQLVANGELLSNRVELQKQAERAARAANKAGGAKRKGTKKITVRAAPVAEENVTYRRKAKPAANRGGDDLLQFIARNSGISEDGLSPASRALGYGGHDLKETHGKFVPGHGELIRKDGHSVDAMGEKLWQEGYFGPHDTAPRPTENDVLEAIRRSIGGEKIYSSWEDGPRGAPKASDFRPPEPGDEDLTALAKRWDAITEANGLPQGLLFSEIDEVRAIMARGTDQLEPFAGDEATASPEEIAPYLHEWVSRDIADTNRRAADNLAAGAVDTEDETYEQYAAAAAQVDAAADRGEPGSAAQAAGAPRAAGEGFAGDTGDAGAGGGQLAEGQAQPGAGGGALPAAGNPELPDARNADGRTAAEQDLAEAAGDLGPNPIFGDKALEPYSDPTGEGVAKAADATWHDIRAGQAKGEAAPAAEPAPAKTPEQLLQDVGTATNREEFLARVRELGAGLEDGATIHDPVTGETWTIRKGATANGTEFVRFETKTGQNSFGFEKRAGETEWRHHGDPYLGEQAQIGGPGEAPAAPSLDLGEQVDPNLARKQAQELDLRAQQPLRGERKTGQAQEAVMGEGLWGGAVEPDLTALAATGKAIDLGDGKGLRTVEQIQADYDAEEASIAKMQAAFEAATSGRHTYETVAPDGTTEKLAPDEIAKAVGPENVPALAQFVDSIDNAGAPPRDDVPLTKPEQALVDAHVTPADEGPIAAAYGQNTYNDVAKRRFVNDVALAITAGLEKVNAAVRDIIKRIINTGLAAAMVFNPVHLHAPAEHMFSARAIAEAPTMHAPAEAHMSPGASLAYERLSGVASSKHTGLIIVDKANGKTHFFDKEGKLITSADTLTGASLGDQLPDYVKSPKKFTVEQIKAIPTADRVTPAGAFVTAKSASGEFLWLNDATGQNHQIAIHTVEIPERLPKLGTKDNRVSFGCVNIDPKVFARTIAPHIDQFDRNVVFVVPHEAAREASLLPAAEPGAPAQAAPDQAQAPPLAPPERRPDLTADDQRRRLDALAARGHAIDLGDGKGLRRVTEIDAELTSQAKAIDTIESCISGGQAA